MANGLTQTQSLGVAGEVIGEMGVIGLTTMTHTNSTAKGGYDYGTT